jgi:pimeloyl-ACP methyl ester carboxylesterase
VPEPEVVAGRRLLKGITVAGLICLCAPASRVSGQSLAPCANTVPQVRAECGTYEVYEDRASRSGRTLELNVMVLRARSEAPAREAIVVLAGGPGQGATSLRRGAASRFGPLREGRDILLVDQRGTGRSNGLRCAYQGSDPRPYFGHVFDPAHFDACRRRLEERANLALYTTMLAAGDLDEIREWLGYEQLNLLGGSYGTRMALIYLRQYPERVRTVVLDGVAPPTLRAPRYYARDAQGAVDRLFDDCLADDACAAAFPKVKHEFAELLARFQNGPVQANVAFPGTTDTVPVPFSRGDFGYAIRGMMYGSDTYRRLPIGIHAAYETNDLSEFAQYYLGRAVGLGRAVSAGMHLAVFCAEDTPHTSPEDFETFTQGTFLGDYLLREYSGACDVWRRGTIPDGYHEHVRSDVPALLFSGWYDPVTPPRWGEEASEHLSNSVHIVVRYAGHGVQGFACRGQLVRDFIESGSLNGLDMSCKDESEPTRFAVPDGGGG